METGYLNFHDEEHFSDFSLSLGQHDLLDDSQSSLLAIDDDFDYVEARMDTSGGLWGTEQELNGDMAVLPVSGVASVIPKIENMKEDFAKVLTDWQEHIGYLQASDMGEDIDMAELSMGIPEKLNTDLPEDIFQNEMAEAQVNAHSSPIKKRQRDSINCQSPKAKTISESSSQDIDVIGLDLSEDLEPELDLMHVDCDQASSFSSDIDYELLAASRGKSKFDLASYITGDDNEVEGSASPSISINDSIETQEDIDREKIVKRNAEKRMDPNRSAKQVLSSPVKNETVDRNSENEESVDVETVIEQMPVLEAGDVKSLLEQFEASEASAVGLAIRQNSRETTEMNNDSTNDRINARVIEQTKQKIVNKTVETQDSKFHKNIRDSLPKEVIDRIKASARKKVISVIPAMSSPKVGTRSTRMQEAAATLSRTKLLKIVANGSNSTNGRVDGSVQLDHDYCSSNGSNSIGRSSDSSSEGIGSDVGMAEITSLSIKKQRHNGTMNGYGGKPAGYYMPIKKIKPENIGNFSTKKTNENPSMKIMDRWADCGSKKDSGLESGDVSDASEETSSSLSSEEKKRNSSISPNDSMNHGQSLSSQSGNNQTITILSKRNGISSMKNKSSSKETPPVYEMKIRSALATSILQLRKGVLTKTKSLDAGHPKVKQQMVSVLKKPPTITNHSSLVLSGYPNESIVTTKNSSNDEVQNIIVQEQQQILDEPLLEAKILAEEAKKPPRRKLNLAEYRSRREQTRSDNSRTCSPIQPMTLVYIHHASTTTEPIKDDPENPVWSEREIVSVLKPKMDVEEEKNRGKPPTREMAVQTNETVFDCPTTATATATTTMRTENDETRQITKIAKNEQSNSETRVTRMRESKNRRYRRRRTSSSSSRSRSRTPSLERSRSRGRTRSRSRNTSRSRSSRSRSRRCSSNPRRRRISHRRSSVSSSSSWSSRSRSHTRSTSRSRSRSLRSRSRSSRSRSRSRSSSRYSSCSRSSSRSNLGRMSKWSIDDRNRRRRGRRDRRTSYDRYRRGSSGSSHSCKGWRRSTRSSYRRQYDGWYHKEKKRQMEERRVIYVGRLDENTTKVDLRRRFEAFGPVLDISVHFREHGDNYGFVTFAYKNDAYEAVEHGNDDPSLPRYDLSFGGRRAFCKVKYADLDGMAGSSLNSGVSNVRPIIKTEEDNTFDLLLKEAKAKLRKRKVARPDSHKLFMQTTTKASHLFLKVCGYQ